MTRSRSSPPGDAPAAAAARARGAGSARHADRRRACRAALDRTPPPPRLRAASARPGAGGPVGRARTRTRHGGTATPASSTPRRSVARAAGDRESANLFRIAQEALENVRDHAQASEVTVTLLERDGGYALSVADDGCGFDPGSRRRGGRPGFASMRARAQLAGGSLRSSPPRAPVPRSRPGCRARPSTPERARMSAGPIRVLIAEENAEARAELVSLVQRAADARAGRAASTLRRRSSSSMREKPAVAVLDVRIPGGGAIAARGIKRRSPSTRVLALSGAATIDRLCSRCSRRAPIGYLVKGSRPRDPGAIGRAAEGQGSLSWR